MMKKLTMAISLLLLLSSGTILNAQEDDKNTRRDFTLGIKAGFNYANVWDAEGQDFKADPRFGFAGGVFLGVPFGESFGFQPELLISQKGFQGSGTILSFPYSFTKTRTYLDIPLQFQAKPIEFLTFVFGPQFSYLLHEKNVYTFGGNSTILENEFNNDNIRKNIFGVVFGADVNIQHLVVSGRIGLDLVANHGDGTSSTPRYKNQWLQFTVGYRL